MSRPLLLCYDGSDASSAAIARAGELLDGEAIVVNVWQSPSSALLWNPVVGAPPVVLAEAAEEIDMGAAEHAERVAGEGAERARAAGFTAEPLAVRGDRGEWHAIVDLAAERDARGIVVGSRGRSRVDSMLLGSVSNGVVHHAECPVIVVPAPRGRDPDAT